MHPAYTQEFAHCLLNGFEPFRTLSTSFELSIVSASSRPISSFVPYVQKTNGTILSINHSAYAGGVFRIPGER